MKKFISILLTATVLLSMVACGAPAVTEATVPTAAEIPTVSDATTPMATEPAPTEAPAESAKTEVPTPPEMVRYYLDVPATGSITYSGEAITPLKATKTLPTVQAQGGVEPYAEYWFGNPRVSADLSDNPALAYSLTFSNTTTFSAMPEGYDPNALLLWGMDPGLNVDILHEYGFTGKGAVIAYVDQPISEHEAYSNVKLHNTNNADSNDSMHGPSVLSLLAGKEIGTAPEAEVYFYGHSAYYADQTTHAECLYQIIAQNKSLPEGEKITMVGFSDGPDFTEKNLDAFLEAQKACEEAGIMVWYCQEYGAATFLPMSDKNNPTNLVPAQWMRIAPELVYVPSSGRTTANMDHTYTYWATGGLSWTMPYVLGLYAIVLEIDPTLTQDGLRKLIVETAYDINGMKLVNPVGFVTKALQNVGRTDEAQVLLDAVAARSKYFYAVVNTAYMSSSDLRGIHSYLATITDATVLVADAAHFGSSESLYTALQADAATRGGETVGVQIFGTPDMVPAFRVGYKVMMSNGEVDDAGTFLSDLFYGNFENAPARVSSGYNVMDHFAENWDVDLVPRWPVARLPLARGEFAAYFEKYHAFLKETGLQRQDLVNFSNPIFASSYHTDDMGTFLNRMKDEFGLLDIPYRLYGNKIGQFPVTTATHGGFTAEELTAENKAGIAEFLINSHGQWNNIDKCYFENGAEKRESLINMGTVNSVLSGNPYYLDLWTCSNGYDMKNNLITTALNGSCVGVFSATSIISNNGVDCSAPLPRMTLSNFYYFYYHYLAALHNGASRSRAFCTAQKEYAAALIAHSANGIRADGFGNYQFNLCNLLTYHNFGVIEPVNVSLSSQNLQTVALAYELIVGSVAPATESIHNVTIQELDNGKTRIEVEFTAGNGASVDIIAPPNIVMRTMIGTGDTQTLTYEISNGKLKQVKRLTLKIYFPYDSGNYFLEQIYPQKSK